MKSVTIVAVSHRCPEYLLRQEEDYRRRCAFFQLRAVTVKPRPSEAKESAAVLAKVTPAATLVALAADGRKMADSDAFARWLARRLQTDSALTFVIGGARGHSPQVLSRAHCRLSLSSLTFAHTLARLVLAEQLFRADCILRGHPYPK